MSQALINDYLAELDRLKKVSGSSRETILREAFKDLLKAWGKAQDLVFLAEYRSADRKERVITLLARVAQVSVETVRIVKALREGPR